MGRVSELCQKAIAIIEEIKQIIAEPAEPTPNVHPWPAFLSSLAKTTSMSLAVRQASAAQAIIETGRGTSTLAREHNNFHGMKWRPEMANAGAVPVEVAVTSEPSGRAEFCKFRTPADAVAGYWAFLQRAPYAGWHSRSATAEAFLRFVCPIWAADPKYLDKCLSVLPEARRLLTENGAEAEPSTPPETVKPTIETTKSSPNQSARGATITHIILHNTAGSYKGAVDWLCDPRSQVSAHLVISRKAETAQLVPFAAKAWHAGNARYNANSIGIEIEATVSQRGMTPEQEAKVIRWCEYLMRQYKIPASNVLVHRMVSNTTCPVLIWPTNEDFLAWRQNCLGA